MHKCSHMQLLHQCAQHKLQHVHGHLIHSSSLFLNLIVYQCVVVLSFLSLSIPVFLSSFLWDACLAASTFLFLCWPVPRCICRGSSLSLQKAQRKKIRKLALMKTRSTVSFSLSSSLSFSFFLSHLLLSLPLLPWTWKDERGGELNLIQTSSPQRQMTGLWSVSVRVWVFCSLIPSLFSRSPLLFFMNGGESPEALQFNLLLAGLMSTALSKGQSLHFLPKWALPGLSLVGCTWISLMVMAHHDTFLAF